AVNLQGKTPAQFVQALIDAKQITGADGRSEQIHGRDAWVGRIGITNSQGQQGTLLAAWIQNGASALQILGQATQGSAEESAIVASMRSFRTLEDPARVNAEPARLRVVPAPIRGTLSENFAQLGTVGIE